MLEPNKTHPKINSKINRKKSHPLLAKVLFYVLLVVFLGGAAYLLFFSGKLNVTSVQLSGTKNIPRSAVLAEVNSQLDGKYFDLLAKNNILLVSGGKIQTDLARRFRLIEKVTVRKKFPDTLLVSIFERTPTLAVCAPGCFMLDENGTAYDQANPNSKSFKAQDLVTLKVQSGLKAALGQKNVLPKDYMNYVLAIRPRLKSDLNLDVAPIYQTPNPMAEEVDVKTKKGWRIYFSTQIPLDKEIQMLQAVLQNEISPDQQSDLEYVDLRIDNKVYYKLKNADNSTAVDQNGNNSQDSISQKSDNNSSKKKKK